MSIYSVKYRLSSCKVTKKLVSELKSEILFQAKEYLQIPDGEVRELLHIMIKEKDNPARQMNQVDFSEERFPDGTKEVIIDSASLVEKFLHIKITFHSSFSEHPLLEISMSDLRAREICEKISDSIKEIVRKYRNSNYAFHNRYIQVGLLALYVIYNVWNYFGIIGWLSPDPDALSLAKTIIFSFVYAIFVLWFIVSIFMKKYITFDTGREKLYVYCYYLVSLVLFIIAAGYLYHVFYMMKIDR